MKRFLMAIICAVFCSAKVDAALYDTANDIRWAYIVTNGVAKVLGAYMTKVDGHYEPCDVVIPSKLGGYTVVSIGSDIIQRVTGATRQPKEDITSVTIPDCVTNISKWAFDAATHVTNVTMRGVETIGEEAFYHCTQLKTVIVGNKLKYISDGAFSGCELLDTFKSYDESQSGVVIPLSVRHIGGGAFRDCSSVRRIIMENTVETISWSSFLNCEPTYLKVPKCVMDSEQNNYVGQAIIGTRYDGNKAISIDTVEYAEGTEIIGIGIFAEKYTIPASATHIKARLHPDDSWYISDIAAWCNMMIYSGSYSGPNDGVNLKDNGHLSSTDDLSNVINYAPLYRAASPWNGGLHLYLNGELVSDLTIPNGVKDINGYMFSFSHDIKSLVVADSVGSIGRSAFSFCSNLTSVVLGAGVSNIHSAAFCQCAKLKSITFNGDAPHMGVMVFRAIDPTCRVYVKRGTDGWGDVPGTWYGMPTAYSTFNVTFNAVSGMVPEKEREVGNGSAIGALPVPTREGYTFSGWWTTANGGSQITATTQVTKDIICYAHWTINQYTVTFDANGGTGGSSKKQNYGSAIVAPTVARTGYTFKGWSPSVAATVPANNVTYKAQWTVNGYTISYNANGGSGAMDGTSATYDSEATIAANGFTRLGHVFKGWATEPGGAVVYAPGQPVTNLTAQSGGVVTLYAVWAEVKVENPVITPADGSIFQTDTCTVTIVCVTPDAKIYYSTNGRTPSVNDRYLYQGPFTISDTTTVTAFAIWNGKMSDYVDATITYVEPEPLTLSGVLDEPNLLAVETGGEAEWQPMYGDYAKIGDSVAVSGAVADDDEFEHQSRLNVKVEGKGTLSFWWRVDCEPDPRGRFTYDRGVLTIDNKEVDKKDGITGWMNHSVTFDTAGEHEIVLTYISDGYLPVEEDVYVGCMWADGFVWTPKEEFPALDASATKEMISQVLSGAADAKLSANIKTVAEYSAFRSWMKGLLGTSQDQVKSSPNAWLSYVLDAGSLIEGTVSDERVKVEEFAVGGESCIFDMKLRIADVSIGAGATIANLLRVFAVEGTTSLADEDFSVEKVALSFGEPDNGSISLAVTPRQAGNAFFVRTRLRDQLNGDKMNGCEVTFNLNGGGSLPEGASAKKFMEYASAYGELPVPTRKGFKFIGWFTEPVDGEMMMEESEVESASAQTLYARWEPTHKYCIVDISSGANAVSYPVVYLDAIPSGGWTDEYKTTKLVLRRIDTGSVGEVEDTTTLPAPYYIGLFEITQRQYALVTGNNPSYSIGDILPVEQVSWNTIRGDAAMHDWPERKTVDSNSFMGRLCARTGIKFDMPSVVQWEYACRAGTQTAYSYGEDADGDYMWYLDNANSTSHMVGTCLPNPWGLFDMHGNAWELCLDKFDSSNSERTACGGAFNSPSSRCESSSRTGTSSEKSNRYYGFRVAIHLNK